MARETNGRRRASLHSRKIAAAAGVLAAAVALLVVGERASEAASPLTLVTIDIGNGFADWDAVLVNSAQTTRDGDGSSGYLVGQATCAAYSTDLDCPQTGGAGNDFLTFAWTYDASNVYLYIERYGSTTNGVDFFFAADVDRDVRLTAADRVVHAKWQPQKPLADRVQISVGTYSPLNATSGDPIRCEPVAPETHCANAAGYMVVPAGHVDGFKLQGSVTGDTPCSAAGGCLGAGDAPTGRLELAIPWTKLVASRQPFYWHVVSSNNGLLDGSADNIGGPGGGLGSFVQRGVSLVPDGSGAVLSPGVVSYVHTLTNDGNDVDSFELSAASSQGAQIEILDGAAVVATDATGDGTWESVLAGYDADGDGTPDLTLAADASRDLTVRVTMPAGRSGQDVTRITATSEGDPSVRATATDTTHLGTPAFVPERQGGYTVPGGAIQFRDTLLNGSVLEGTFDLTPDAGCAGSRVELALDAGSGPGEIVATDPLGDGAWDQGTVSPSADSDADGLPDLGPLAAGTSRSFYVLVTPPPDAAIGSACTMVLSATGNAGGSAAVAHVVHASNAVTFDPDYRGTTPNAADAQDARIPKGSTVFFSAFVRNAESVPRVYNLSVSTTGAGATVPRIWTDPDGDGNPSDGRVVTQTDQLAAWGGTQHLVVEVGAASGATTRTLLVTTATAAAVSGGASDTQVSEAVVAYLGSYADALHAKAQNVFAPCSTIYVYARGLAPSDATRYVLEWGPPVGSLPPPISPWATTANGTADARLDLPAADPGSWTWSARLTDTGVQIDSLPFTVELNGAVSTLATDRARYLPGDAVGVTATVRNDGRASLDQTSLAYGGAADRLRTGVDVAAGGTASDAFTFVLDPSTAPGTQTLTLGWQLACASGPFALASASFDVLPPPPSIATPEAGAFLATTTPTITGTALAGASVVVSITDPTGTRVSAGVVADSTTGAWSYDVPGSSALSQGSHEATATQAVGGVTSEPSGAVAFTVDTEAPVAPSITSPTDPTVTATAGIAVSGRAGDPGAVDVAVLVDGTVVTTVPVVAGEFSVTLTLAEGAHVLTARALDEARNDSSDSLPVSVTVDMTAPAQPSLDPIASPTSSNPVHVTGTAEAGALVEVYEGTLVIATATAGANGVFSVDVSLGEGAHSIFVRVADAAGNVAPDSDPISLTVDRTAPAAPVIDEPVDGASIASGALTVRGHAEPGAQVRVTGAGNDAVATAAPDGSWEAALVVPDGTHVLTATATDAAGNSSPEATVSVTASTVSGGGGGGGCGCGSGQNAAPTMLLALALAMFAPSRRRNAGSCVRAGESDAYERGSNSRRRH